MQQWVDRKYIIALAGRLEGFKQKSSNLYNFKCPLCGDSKTNKSKKRGYFFLKDGSFYFYCHNGCGQYALKTILKKLDLRLYQDYSLELLLAKQNDNKDVIFKSNTSIKFDHGPYSSELKNLQKISQLPVNHPAKLYIESRKIPTPYHSVYRWCPNFMHWTNSLVPQKFEEKHLRFDEGRILIPFFDKDNKFFAYTGRAINDIKNGQRYILIILNHDIPLIYGMNGLKQDEKAYVVEGPIDSLYLKNSIAMAGSNIGVLTNIKHHDNLVIVFDNEKHSKETKSKILQAIHLGFKVCIWPLWLEYKDINQMIIAEWSPEYIKEVIDEHTFSGMEARIKLEESYK